LRACSPRDLDSVIIIVIVIIIFAGLGIRLRALQMLGKHLATSVVPIISTIIVVVNIFIFGSTGV
jgi:hypothetical protein